MLMGVSDTSAAEEQGRAEREAAEAPQLPATEGKPGSTRGELGAMPLNQCDAGGPPRERDRLIDGIWKRKQQHGREHRPMHHTNSVALY